MRWACSMDGEETGYKVCNGNVLQD